MKRSAVMGSLLIPLVVGGCGGVADPERPDLDGVLGYARFTLQCEYEGCSDVETVPSFVRGAEFDFTVEVSGAVPDADRHPRTDIHLGDQRYVDDVEVRTVLAISTRSDRLIDYAFVYLYDPDQFILRGDTGSRLERDAGGDGYEIPLGTEVSANVFAYRFGQQLAGNPRVQARALDPDALSVTRTFDGIELYGTRSGITQVELSTAAHTEIVDVRVVSGSRTNPPAPEPTPPRTNPTPDPTDTEGTTGGDTDTDTDTTTGSGTDTATDTDTDTDTTSSGGMR